MSETHGHGRVFDVEVLLRGAERWLEPASDDRQGQQATPAAMVTVDEAEFRRLPSAVALYRAAQAQINGDRERTEAFAHRASTSPAKTIHSGVVRRPTCFLAHWGAGDLDAGPGSASGPRRWRAAERAGHAVDAIGCNRPLAEIRMAQGRLNEAMRSYEQGLRMRTPTAR